MAKLRIALLGSTRGTAMLSLIRAINDHQLEVQIELVLSNKSSACILGRGQQQGLNTLFIDDRLGQCFFEAELAQALHKHRIDVLVLIGYMRILSPFFVNEWAQKIINIHPSLLPDFAGLKDLAVHEAVLKSGSTISGCTVHYVIKEVDKGPIIIQKKCLVYPGDTIEQLKERVQSLEGLALIEALKLLSYVKLPNR